VWDRCEKCKSASKRRLALLPAPSLLRHFPRRPRPAARLTTPHPRTLPGIYLIVDALLNWYFIKVVRARLVRNGLERYRPLVRFNQRLIVLSISMDALIIGMMSLPNTFVCASRLRSHRALEASFLPLSQPGNGL